MCIAIPKKVLSVKKVAGGQVAMVEGNAGEEKIDISLLDAVKEGDFILVFRSVALRKIDEAEANQISEALKCVDAVMRGEGDATTIESGFGDLIHEEPQLPEHLKALVGKKTLED